MEYILGFEIDEGHLFSQQAPGNILECQTGLIFPVQSQRLAPVGCHNDIFILGHDPNQVNRQQVEHVFDGKHVAMPDHAGVKPVDDEGGRSFAFGFQDTDDPVGIPHGRDLGVGKYEYAVGGGYGILEATLDAGG